MENEFQSLSDDLRERAGQLAKDFSERATGYYDEAQDWLDKNSSRVLPLVGVVAAVGLAGYLVARGTRANARHEKGQTDRIA